MRAFLAEHCPPELVERVWATGTIHDWGLHRALAERGWLTAAWPVDHGGLGLDAFEMAAMTEELARVDAPMDGWGTAELVARTIDLCGTDQQRREILPRLLGGEVLACLGYSEPDAGSDIAAASTRAVRDGDDWVVNGQKMFTTMAHESAYVLLLTRTNPDVPKHRGLTMFLVPMDTPGIEISPIETLGGERTNVTFYSDVRVPDSCRIGDVDGGWRVLTVALAFERQPVAQGQTRRLYRHVVGWATASERDGRPLLEHDSVRSRLAEVAVDIEVGALLAYEMTTIIARGDLPIVEGSITKLFVTEALVRAASSLLDVTGADGVLAHGSPGRARGRVDRAHVPARPGDDDPLGEQRDPAQHRRRARARTPEGAVTCRRGPASSKRHPISPPRSRAASRRMASVCSRPCGTDGAPRLSGVEPLFAHDDLWIGMMPESLKAADLLRDPRFALHSATVDKNVTDGDAKIAGRALAVAADDTATFSQFLAAFEAATGYPPPDGPFHLFRADVHEVSMIRPGGDHLDIDFWRERDGLHHVDRY